MLVNVYFLRVGLFQAFGTCFFGVLLLIVECWLLFSLESGQRPLNVQTRTL